MRRASSLTNTIVMFPVPRRVKSISLRGAVPDQPREAVPGVAPGVFVTPQQSGVVEGPSRGVELPGLSISLPEMTLSLPRFRLHGLTHLSRSTHGNGPSRPPTYPIHTTLPPSCTKADHCPRAVRDREREAEPDEDQGEDREAEPSCCLAENACERASTADLEKRLHRLEGCFDQQMQALESCIQEIRALRSHQPQASIAPSYVPPSESGLEPMGEDPSGLRAAPAHYTIHHGSDPQVKRATHVTVVPPPATPNVGNVRRLPTVTREQAAAALSAVVKN